MPNLSHLVQNVQTLFANLACQAACATDFVKRKSILSYLSRGFYCQTQL